jgi:hypothetical protein
MEENYTQCLLIYEKAQEPTKWQVAWIPTQFAVEGKILRIKNWAFWVENWRVDEIYGTAPAERIEKHERDYLEFHVG